MESRNWTIKKERNAAIKQLKHGRMEETPRIEHELMEEVEPLGPSKKTEYHD